MHGDCSIVGAFLLDVLRLSTVYRVITRLLQVQTSSSAIVLIIHSCIHFCTDFNLQNDCEVAASRPSRIDSVCTRVFGGISAPKPNSSSGPARRFSNFRDRGSSLGAKM